MPGTNDVLAHLATLDFEGHDEQSIREQWIYPLLTLLGYGDVRHRVDIPLKVDLADPVRAIGHHRYEVDYRPTVYGVGLWIIEAKKPAEDLFSDQHLGQAWSYATHPEVDVPFMVMANGQRLCVYDITKTAWDKQPEIDIAQVNLVEEFPQLQEALGARRVADFVRRRQLRHLGTALKAQLDDGVLEQTRADVEKILEEAQPAVERNRRELALEAYAQADADRERAGREIGVFGMASACISASVPVGGDVDLCAEIIRELPPEHRADAFDEFEKAATFDGTVKETFALHVLKLAVALRLTSDEACGERARAVAEDAAEGGATGFAGDPVRAASHDLERVLPAFLARLVLTRNTDSAIRSAEELKQHMDVEQWIRQNAEFGLGADAILAQHVELAFRAIWVQFSPWTEKALTETAQHLARALPDLPLRRDVEIGQIGNAFYETAVAHDPLWPGTKNVLSQVANPPTREKGSEELAEQSAFASELLERLFAGGPPGTD